MRQEIHKVRELTNKPFSVNVLPVQNGDDIYTPSMLKVIYEEKVPVVTFVGEPDEKMFRDFKEHDIKIVYRSLNPTPENARLAEKYGADIIVATGFDEGGTLPDKVLGTFSIVPLIADSVEHTSVQNHTGVLPFAPRLPSGRSLAYVKPQTVINRFGSESARVYALASFENISKFKALADTTESQFEKLFCLITGKKRYIINIYKVLFV